MRGVRDEPALRIRSGLQPAQHRVHGLRQAGDLIPAVRDGHPGILVGCGDPGDLLAGSVGIGYAASAVLFAAAITVIALAHDKLHLDPVLAFWAAYILTRPLGASVGDLLAQAPSDGGLGLGTTATSGLFLLAIAGTVAYLSITRRDVEAAHGDASLEPAHS